MTTGVASSLRDAGENYTPNQIVLVADAVLRIRSGAGPAKPRTRRGTPDEFKAMLLGMTGR